MSRITISWPLAGEEEKIQALLMQDGLHLNGGDWRGFERTWLTARSEGRIVACICYHPGVPIARLDFLTIDSSVQGIPRVRVVRAILEAAFAIAALNGASFVTGVVPSYMPDYGEFLAKRGGRQINEGWLYIASLSDVLKRRNEVHGRIKANNDHNGHANAGRD